MKTFALVSGAAAFTAALAIGHCALGADADASNPGKSLFSPPSTAATANLHLLVSPTQETFRIDQPIRFRLAGSDKFYLYVYNVDDNGKTATLVLAANTAKDRYEQGQIYTVPESGFSATKAGLEHVVFVASRKFIPLAEARAGAGAVTTTEKAIERQFAAKGLVLRSTTPDADVEVQRLELKVTSATGSTSAPPAAAPAPVAASGSEAAIPFVAVDRPQYAVGEPVRVVYGATQAGYLHLFLVEPTGKRTQWLKLPVEAGKVYTNTTRATSPTGDHTLIAAFTADGKNEPEVSSPEVGQANLSGKGLEPPGGSGAPVAMYHFTIHDASP